MLATLIVETDAGGMPQRDIEAALEKALGQFVRSQSAISDLTDRLAHATVAVLGEQNGRGVCLGHRCGRVESADGRRLA